MKKTVFLWVYNPIDSCSTPISMFLSTQYDFIVFRSLSASHPPWRAISLGTCGFIVARFPETRWNPHIVVGCLPMKLERSLLCSELVRENDLLMGKYWNIIVCCRRVGRMPLNPSKVIVRYRRWMFWSLVFGTRPLHLLDHCMSVVLQLLWKVILHKLKKGKME